MPYHYTERLIPEVVLKAYETLELGCVLPFTFYISRHGSGLVTDASPVGVMFLTEFPEEIATLPPPTTRARAWFIQKYGNQYMQGVIQGMSLPDWPAMRAAHPRDKEGVEDGAAMRRLFDIYHLPVISGSAGVLQATRPESKPKETSDADTALRDDGNDGGQGSIPSHE